MSAMRLLRRSEDRTLTDRVTWQAASLLLAYPDDERLRRMATAADLIEQLRGPAKEKLNRAHAELSALEPFSAAKDYVATFDLAKRTTMYLTFWTAGDTRNRGTAMHAFLAAYRDAGVIEPKAEAPDHLPVVLEFAALVDPVAGRRLLVEHRVAIDVLADALAERGSPYAHVVAAVCATLPAATNQDMARADRLAQAGPPAEAVGLQPFTLTVPPKRTAGAQ